MKKVTDSFPGKIILSGEHAVVHGCPAVAVAIDRYVTAEASYQDKLEFTVDITNVDEQITFPLHHLPRLLAELRQRYQQFLKGEYKIKQVLDNPFQLIHFIFAQLNERAPRLGEKGIYLKINSHIPIGSGLGSSAAIILAVISVLTKLEKMELSKQDLFALALEAENLQHGHSSGLDLQVCYAGGGLIYEKGVATFLNIPEFSFYLVNTGTPESTTGECVSNVKQYFEDERIKKLFQDITHKMIFDLNHGNHFELIDDVRANSRLLEDLGVVPKKVQRFIRAIELNGGAAKICGAGSISGDTAGMLFVLASPEPEELCKTYGYDLLEVKVAPRQGRGA